MVYYNQKEGERTPNKTEPAEPGKGNEMDKRYEARLEMKEMVKEAEFLINSEIESYVKRGWTMASHCQDISEKFGFIFQVRRRRNGKISVCFA